MTDGASEKHKLTEVSSFIADLPTVVQKFWSGVAEPVFELSISLVVVFFALGADEKVENSILTQVNAIPEISSQDSYGIRTLIPVAVLVFFLGIAQGNSKLLRVIGAAIPGRLVANRTSLLLQNVPSLEIVEAWHYNSRLGNVEELNTEIDTTISRVPLDPAKDTLSKIRAMQGRSDSLDSTADFIKGLFAVTIIVVVAFHVFESWPIHWGHMAFVTAIAFVSLIYLALGRIQAEREYACRKVKDYNFQKKALGQAPAAPDERQLEELQRLRPYPYLEPAWKSNLVLPVVQHDLRTLFESMWFWKY